MRSRYRIEAGQPILDVRVATLEQLFDNRDPAPFRDRDLDPELVEYLLDGARELAGTKPLRIAIWLESPAAGDVEQAVRAHFEHELNRSDRRRREQVRAGWIGLAIAAVVVVVLITVGEMVERRVTGALGTGLREALVISGWVLMWRPLEVLVYDRITWRRDRRLLLSIRDAAVEVHARESGTPGAQR
jgi:hypothetical protein